MGMIPGPLSHPGKPRVIRKVLKWDAKGRPKVAVDRKLNARVERVTARDPRLCNSKKCATTFDSLSKAGVIARRTEYAKVHANEGKGKFIAGRMIYSPRDYHVFCLPEEYKPLIRFLWPNINSRNPAP